ncbi:UDP-N-acetylmuramate dehydrogenase [Clostridium pasteurianum]|nr:circularly permuted type 2 ATP-grasp protein [Clostridium pasteurianum]AOZ77326.1 UDP-N-acetylmuramate dehydrogenase [Clostridium pasteurianum DSM 525 = ATCC 6013]AOZ81123.1 UDP-N-acetylmuramate dehydrogenase [Clostridium pasteurianum]OMH22878.1 UDP-N-acetylmuramate dehydrogenase [Clostridium pasteurianum]UZW16295.1 circularly permuted type 2 ATP-grasp protein [Clostridium pasteurianum]
MLTQHTKLVNEWLERYGVKFGIYKNDKFIEQLFPFDAIPRIIEADKFALLEKGLIQRVCALNLFLKDIYSNRCILRDKIIPEEFVYSSKGFFAECCGITPPKGIYSHVAGIDLVEAKDGWYVLEDNLRIPSGASYPMIAREITRSISPETFEKNKVCENRNYASILSKMLEEVNCGGINVVMTPGRYNSAFFEHSYLAEKMGAVLAFPGDLQVQNGVVYYNKFNGGKQRVGAIYHRVSDEYIDPIAFQQDSVIGVPHLMEAYKKGNVALVNAPGNGIADDKGIYYFVPAMISYYLGEDPILKNAPTYLPFFKEDEKYVLENLEKLVIKDVSESGGYGVVFGSELSKEERNNLRNIIIDNPRRFIAQEVIDFLDLMVLEGEEAVPRKADLRAFVIHGKDVSVWKSGLTRFSRNPNSFVVNSSQGGGFKDTWIISQ